MDRKFPSFSFMRIALIVVIPLAVTLSASAAVTLKTWTAGETLRASDLNANFKSIRDAMAVERVASPIVTVVTGNVMVATATCPAGKVVVGGGCIYDTVSDSCCMVPLEGYPDTDTTFTCKVYNSSGNNRSGQAFAICAGF